MYTKEKKTNKPTLLINQPSVPLNTTHNPIKHKTTKQTKQTQQNPNK